MALVVAHAESDVRVVGRDMDFSHKRNLVGQTWEVVDATATAVWRSAHLATFTPAPRPLGFSVAPVSTIGHFGHVVEAAVRTHPRAHLQSVVLCRVRRGSCEIAHKTERPYPETRPPKRGATHAGRRVGSARVAVAVLRNCVVTHVSSNDGAPRLSPSRI